MSAYFEKALKLIKKDPMPDDIIEQLDDLFELADPDEQDEFGWIYEGAHLEVDEV